MSFTLGLAIGALFVLMAAVPAIFWFERKTSQARRIMGLCKQILDQLPDVVFFKDHQGVYRYVNHQVVKMLGTNPVGKTDSEVFDQAIARRHQSLDRRTIASASVQKAEEWLTDVEGEQILVQTSKAPLIGDDHRCTGVIGVARDVTELKMAQDNLERVAHHDALTGLGNRVLLVKEFDYALRLSQRRAESLAVIYLDLDRFKDVNDSLGHEIGDLLLKNVADRLSRSLRGSDLCARLGGDEFVLVLPGSGSVNELQRKAERLLEAISEAYEIRGHSVKIFASAGVAIYPDHGETVETLIRHADTALRAAKESGRACVRFYESSMSHSLVSRLSLEQDLRGALEKDELFMVYQPQFRQGKCQPDRVEALMRWKHPLRGMVSPREFIAVAEATGQIVNLGFWALETACKQFIQWRKQGLVLEKVAINVSAIQINHSFAEETLAILKGLSFNPTWLELEVTETAMMNGVTEVTQQMDRLRSRGVEFSIDDFGTGYSSLSKIKSMPVSVLKIDQSFVRDIDTDRNDYEIARAVILMAKSIGLSVVAEGVEKKGQQEILDELDCDWNQGYLYGLPLTGDEFLGQYPSELVSL